MNKTVRWLLIFGVLLLVVVAMTWVLMRNNWSRTTVSAGQRVFHADVAEKDWTRQRGLAGRKGLDPGQAMLFKFETDDLWGIWMKGMKFPIDIIWINKDDHVVHIEHSIEPDGEPHEEYRPPVPARYVLEVAAGEARQANIQVGSTVKFDVVKKGF